MNTLWVFSIEPIPSRYTIQWHTHVPALLSKELGGVCNVQQIDGDTMPGKLTEGEFLDFASTNQWKNEQANKFMAMCKTGEVQKGDNVIFMDAWNPVIPQIKYVSELKKLSLKLHGLWHAGSYDPADFLGRLIGDVPWIRNLERSIFDCLDHNYFATMFHVKLHNHTFAERNYLMDIANKKIVLTGWPFEFLEKNINSCDCHIYQYQVCDICQRTVKKRDLILFPHRLAPEKQLPIFEDLAKTLPQYEWDVCQSRPLTKQEYHKLLLEAKIVFSASLQETLGISMCLEGPLAGAIPLAPNRLSYDEIFEMYPEFEYPSAWTQDWNSYLKHKDQLVSRITGIMETYDQYDIIIHDYNKLTLPQYGSFTKAIAQIKQCFS